ncbi:hypothetical protein Tco_0488034 [Tanacetum coccineum]
MLDPSPNSLVHGESLEIRDNHRWENLSNGEWSGPAGFELARENLKSRIEEEDSITNVENAVLDLGVMKSLCSLFVDQRVLIGLKRAKQAFPLLLRSKAVLMLIGCDMCFP